MAKQRSIKEVAHTPGPWEYDATWALIKGGPDGVEVAAVHAAVKEGQRIDRAQPAIAAANARLIAASPDLLRFAEAIEESVNDALRGGSPDTFMTLVKRLRDYREWARAAIAKATGAK